MEFTKKNLLQLRKMSIDELSVYYMNERKYNFENGIPIKNIKFRNRIHSLLVLIIKIDRLLAKETLTVIKDYRIKTTNPKIYACTHIGGNDIQRTFEAIKEPAYLFLGDPKGIYRDLSGLLLFLNGYIPFETNNKIDRKIATKRSTELLKSGGNLLIYPEGAWNITPNLPVMKLYDGTASMALETGSDIIPIGIEQYDKDFFVSIGKNIVTKELSGIKVKELTLLLRDEMATQKWNIWDYRPIEKRNIVAQTSLEDFQRQIIDRCEYDFSIQDVLDTMYKDPSIVLPEEAFGFQKKYIR